LHYSNILSVRTTTRKVYRKKRKEKIMSTIFLLTPTDDAIIFLLGIFFYGGLIYLAIYLIRVWLGSWKNHIK